MSRESAQHSPRADDELKAELQGELKGNGPTRAEDWREPELSADDDEPAPPPVGES
ncbi:hypothetical protein [Amycolatopsis sp. NPDC051372]|uniref:hypothetical protein n=1 Tax=unclassified Amycolatopsis TaxID=2618356 RepID=UPI003425F7BF